MTITVHLDPRDEERLGKLAAERGETIEETARFAIVNLLYTLDWGHDSEEDWARSCESMMAKNLPPEDWSDVFDSPTDP